MYPRPCRVASGVVLLLGLVGCNKAPVLKTVAAGGIVTHQGQPVEGASVSFYPVTAESGRSAFGVTGSDGRFTLQTPVGGSTNSKGALAGDYKVTVVKSSDPVAMQGTATTDEERQKLMQEMKEKGAAATDAMKEGAQGMQAGQGSEVKSQLPQKYADVKITDLKATVVAGDKNDFPFDLSD